ncbi:MAG: DUF58 domain-containing protein [Treponema sp.]|nr:DUF58 domain-containing protein [Treponema sp.]
MGIIVLVPLYIFVPFVLVQFLCLFLLFLLIGSRLYSEHLVRNIKIIRQDSEFRVFRYEWVQVELKAENYGLLPAFMLGISDFPGPLPVFKNNQVLCSLARRSWSLFTWQGHCTDRGAFFLGPVTVNGTDPLGLFPFQLTFDETSRLYVYPIVRSIFLKNPKGIPLGNMISPNPLFEDITRRRSLRPYQSGDEPRRINWKASARMSASSIEGGPNFMIDEYDATAAYPLMIFLNVDQNDYPTKKQGAFIERAIEAAAALCLKAAHERQELGIVIYASREEGGVSVIAPAAFTVVPILERLAALDWTATPDVPKNSGENYSHGSALSMLEQGKHLPYGTRFLYVGPDLGDEAYISLNSLKRHHLFLEYLIISERVMPLLVPGNSPRHKMKEDGDEII